MSKPLLDGYGRCYLTSPLTQSHALCTIGTLPAPLASCNLPVERRPIYEKEGRDKWVCCWMDTFFSCAIRKSRPHISYFILSTLLTSSLHVLITLLSLKSLLRIFNYLYHCLCKVQDVPPQYTGRGRVFCSCQAHNVNRIEIRSYTCLNYIIA